MHSSSSESWGSKAGRSLDLIHCNPWWGFGFEGLACWEEVRSRGSEPFTHRHKLYLLLLLLHIPAGPQERRAQIPELCHTCDTWLPSSEKGRLPLPVDRGQAEGREEKEDILFIANVSR